MEKRVKITLKNLVEDVGGRFLDEGFCQVRIISGDSSMRGVFIGELDKRKIPYSVYSKDFGLSSNNVYTVDLSKIRLKY